jgi:uncharacterized protein DUF6510
MTSHSALDGNALAGPLSEVLSFDITTAVATCAGCGSRSPGAAWVVFVEAPGIVARCASCERVQIRLMHDDRGRTWVDLSGIDTVEIDVQGASRSSTQPRPSRR